MKRGVLNCIVQQYYDSASKKSLAHSHPAPILAVIFSECDDGNFFKNTNEGEGHQILIFILMLTLLKFLFFPSVLREKKKKWKQEFWMRHLHFLVDFDLILVYVPLMCMVENCTFSLMGRSLLTMVYSAVFNHVSCLQLWE